ncbi:acyltransferase [Gluconacetobacter azotocaptans]|uniref:acyltransferase family protein n=1 Tax=Gluconacetobacter azotocaptans TaxID=142834 RepID=UPI00195A92A9|nr:acyltransferase [Gluconacetobacter azotocaptans]MBM9400505.1 acyltransferase [Gluconacetobacter azotocaptans]
MAKRVFHTLDGLRGLAAAGVVLGHINMIFPTAWYVTGGYLAVDLFFALSGFVLAEAYSARLDAGLPFAAFMRKRIVRLWPLYALGLSIGTVATALQVALNLKPLSVLASLPAAVFYIPWVGPHGELYALNFPAWSLFYELVANMVMAAAWPWLTTRRLMAVVGLFVPGLIVSAFSWGTLNVGMFWSGAPVAVCRVGFSFFLGILLWRVRRESPVLNAWVPMGLLAFVMVFDTPAIPRPVIDLVAVFAIFPVIVWLGASSQPKGRSLVVFQAAGGASYALYATHAPLVWCIGGVLGKGLHIPLATVPAWIAPVMLAGLYALAWLLDGLDMAARARFDRAIDWMSRRAVRTAPLA